MRNWNYRSVLVLAGLTAALSLSLARTAVAEEKEGKEENEVKVKMADVPQAVRTTLEREAEGATLPEQVDKETDDGKVIYEADVKIGGKNYEIKTQEDGTLVSKTLDQEDEKGGKEEKDEKGEKGEKSGKADAEKKDKD